MVLTHVHDMTEFVKDGVEICEGPDSYEVAVAAKRQFERDLDMQVSRSVIYFICSVKFLS